MTFGSLRTVSGSALRKNSPIVQHHNVLAQPHNKAHVMLDEQNGHAEFFPYKFDGLHQLCRFIWVHARRRFVQQKQLRDSLASALAISSLRCLP